MSTSVSKTLISGILPATIDVTGAVQGNGIIFNGTKAVWGTISTSSAGPAGPQGPQGIKGDTGAQGPMGPAGSGGVGTGTVGPQGPQGIKGDTGTQGVQGVKGDTGSQGLQGVKGDTGAQGIKGDKGDTGSQGLKGDRGEQGFIGPKGDRGEQGIQGVKGDQGLTGGSGPAGPAGVAAPVNVDNTPIGCITHFAASTAPTGYLECNGSSVSRATYADLFLVIGTLYGTVDLIHFTLPDLRGEFIRGWDHGRGVDAGRAFGSSQKGSLIAFDSTTSTATVAGVTNVTTGVTPESNAKFEYGYDQINPSEYNSGQAKYAGITGTTATITSEPNNFGATRPRNVALLPCIKAVKTVTGNIQSLNFIEKPTATEGQVLTFNSSTTQWVAADASTGSSKVKTISAPYIITPGDNQYIIRCTNTQAITITLPESASFAIGTEIIITQISTFQLTIAAANTNVKILSFGNRLKTTGQYSVLSLICTAANEWLLAGDLVA